jgi:hypothetical protein
VTLEEMAADFRRRVPRKSAAKGAKRRK